MRPPHHRPVDRQRRLPAVPDAADQLRCAVWRKPAPARRADRAAGRRCRPCQRGSRRQRVSCRLHDAVTKPAVAVLGAGSWGTASPLIAATGTAFYGAVGRDAATIAAIEATGENPRYLPGIPAGQPRDHRPAEAMADTPTSCWWWCPRMPSPKPCARWHRGASRARAWPWATKGLRTRQRRFLHEVAGEVLATKCRWRWSPARPSPRKWRRACPRH